MDILRFFDGNRDMKKKCRLEMSFFKNISISTTQRTLYHYKNAKLNGRTTKSNSLFIANCFNTHIQSACSFNAQFIIVLFIRVKN